MSGVQERILKFQELIGDHYLEALHSVVLKGERSLTISFQEIIKFDPDLSEYMMNDPENAVKELEVAVQQFDIAE